MEKKLTQEEFQEFMIEQIGGLQADVSSLRTEMREGFAAASRTVDRIERMLTPLSTAVDKDAETIVEHDRRLTRIEKHVELRRA